MATTEDTFRVYTQAQGETYAAQRPAYSPNLFNAVIDHHASTGGQLNTVVDVGCGTGQATRGLSRYFANGIGLDPSKGMIDTARGLTDATSPIRFEVSAAEVLGRDLELPIADGSVDLLTAATAAHWFDMGSFWSSAARVLKPGGTVALWARTGTAINPIKTPNGAAIKTVVADVFENELRQYAMHGNKLTRELYADLPLPWTLEAPVKEFDKESFFRKVWNEKRDGLEDDEVGTRGTVTPEQLEKIIGTGSLVTRWREANPDKAGTEEDVLRKLRWRIEGLLQDVGMNPGDAVLTGEVAVVLLMVKKI